MRKGLIVISLVLLFALITFADWERTYWGGKKSDGISSVARTSDGSFIAIGVTNSFSVGQCDLWLLKVSPDGRIPWMKRYGGKNIDKGLHISPTSDGNYVAIGETWSFGGEELWVLKFDANGDTIWTRRYGRGEHTRAVGTSIIEASDGGYTAIGWISTLWEGRKIWLLRLDSTGDTLWTRTFGINSAMSNDEGKMLIQTSDGGYLFGGTTMRLNKKYDRWSSDIYIIKAKSNGDTLWNRVYYGGDDGSGAYSCIETPDKGYIVVGQEWHFGSRSRCDIFVMKLSYNGKKLWKKVYGGEDDELGGFIASTSDKGYIITGATQSYGFGKTSLWFLKLDDKGDTLWTRIYGEKGYLSIGNLATQTSDGGYIIWGVKGTYMTNVDLYIIKIDPAGRKEYEQVVPLSMYLIAYPNPFNNVCNIEVNLLSDNRKVEVYDITGRRIANLPVTKTRGTQKIIWTPENIPSGAYLIRVTDGKRTTTKRIVLIR